MTHPKNLPLVNINGTFPGTLEHQVELVEAAAKLLVDALTAACPHGRDYPHNQGGFAEIYQANLDRRIAVSEIRRWATEVRASLRDQEISPNQQIIRSIKQKG